MLGLPTVLVAFNQSGHRCYNTFQQGYGTFERRESREEGRDIFEPFTAEPFKRLVYFEFDDKVVCKCALSLHIALATLVELTNNTKY